MVRIGIKMIHLKRNGGGGWAGKTKKNIQKKKKV